MNKYNRMWIEQIWAHRRKLKRDPIRYYPTPLGACIRATIALLLNRWDESILEWDRNGEDVAWMDQGPYETDYGIGQSFEYLKVQGFRVAVGCDGTL